MIRIQLAGINIEIHNRYPYTEQLCKDYLTESGRMDFTVSVTEEQIKTEQEQTDRDFSPGYCESICIYREICKKLPSYQAFLMHSAVVETDGAAYAFTAKSGTGKSTHVNLWLRKFGSRARIINGDKPIFRLGNDNILSVYGTPWCGKEGLHINTHVRLQAIAFIERSKTNHISEMNPGEVIRRIFHQLLMPKDKDTMDAMLCLLDRLIQTTPCYLLKCNQEQEAADIAYRAMKKAGG